MRVRKGWAALLALVIIFLLSSSTALASDGRPVFACFSPRNADLIGRLGPGDGSVRFAFQIGACLALQTGIPAGAVSRQGAVWQFQLYGAALPLYTPDWGADFAGPRADDARVRDFSQFVPGTARLLDSGRMFVYCDAAEEDLARRWQDFRKRWDAYQLQRRRSVASTTFIVRRHFSEQGPKLVTEADALQAERSRLERQCAAVHDLELDQHFVEFLRTAALR